MVARLILILCPLFFCSCSILNSGSANLKYTVSKAKFDGVRYRNVDRLSDGSFSLRNMQHPRGFDRWDYTFRLSPSIHGDKTTYEAVSRTINADGTERVYPRMKIKRLSGLGNVKLTFHTPAGGINLTAGFGLTLYHQADGQGIDTVRSREIRKLDLNWFAFISERFFVQIGPRYYKEKYESYVFALRLGYFWGDIES